ncbi:MAG TPA: M20/M25/M40 family metallo-hydrolase [Anaerolineae bacterium]|nr:M20/M25/M40 family metallo-hydrolase [Anaerolineae bacterium]
MIRSNDSRLEELRDFLQQGEAADLALKLGQINSPHGAEGEAGKFVFDWLQKNKIPARLQEVLPGRYNAIGVLRGSGGSPSLILNSHLDTAYGAAEDIWTAGRFHRGDIEAWAEGDRLYGQGVVNDKAPMAATLLALKAIHQFQLPLQGDLIFTGVAGEIGQAPIDEYQGTQYEGKGTGTRYSVLHGVVADYALVAECTNWCMTAVECGDLLVKVTIYGRAVYTPFLSRANDSPNAIVKATQFIASFEEWAAEYEKQNSYMSPSGPVVPKASIGAIRGGLPYKPIETAGVCALYLDIRISPHGDPNDVLRDLRALIAQCGLDAELQPFLFRKGYEGKNIELLQEAIQQAHTRVFPNPPATPDAPVSSMWRDLNVYNEVGIPAITYGPPLGLSSEGWSYFIRRDDVNLAAELYAMIALDVCNRE